LEPGRNEAAAIVEPPEDYHQLCGTANEFCSTGRINNGCYNQSVPDNAKPRLTEMVKAAG
jgi:hypothetical protein